jgi:hypothetical protein
MGYVYLGSYSTVQVLSADQVQDILRITFRTTPSGVVAYANAPTATLQAAAVTSALTAADLFAAPMADGIERAMASGKVGGIAAVQDTDRSGLLQDYLEVTVEYVSTSATNPGTFDATIRIPAFDFTSEEFYGTVVGGPIDALYAQLQRLAGA